MRSERTQQKVATHVNRLEAALKKKNLQRAKEIRQNDLNAIFRDVKDTLVTCRNAQVLQIDKDEHAIEYEAPASFDFSLPIFGPQGALDIVHATEDKRWIANDPLPVEGDKLHQQVHHGSIAELHQKFLTGGTPGGIATVAPQMKTGNLA